MKKEKFYEIGLDVADNGMLHRYFIGRKRVRNIVHTNSAPTYSAGVVGTGIGTLSSIAVFRLPEKLFNHLQKVADSQNWDFFKTSALSGKPIDILVYHNSLVMQCQKESFRIPEVSWKEWRKQK
ncbi:MAG: hypothetical protein JRI45_06665 [Deltaproteobacteria bacterium]|nr:hypothetical protein [Deltaproteobacteria bacterium]